MNKFLAGKIRELSGKAGEPIVGDNRAVIIPVSNNGKFETYFYNKLKQFTDLLKYFEKNYDDDDEEQ
jgi:hypothetical protein